MANEVSIWNKVMSSAMTVPGVKVDRESFLRKEFSLYCSAEQLDKYGAQNEAYMSRSAEKWVRCLCFNELGVCG